ncbi:MAG TPA: AI-2E family transporter [Candidatus Dormibacteraeota bacterium]|nr:AI-2E family transporter [Candidatus Dormibacteraeota bacterium]
MIDARTTAERVLVILLTTIAVLFVAYLCYRLAGIIELIIVSIFLAAALNPLVNALRRWRLPRVPAILMVFLLLLVSVLAIAALAFPSLLAQAKAILAILQQPEGLTHELQRLAAPLGLSGIVQRFHIQIEALPAQLGSAAGSFTTVTTNTVNGVAAFGAVLVLTFFMLSDGETMVGGLLRLAPETQRPRLQSLLQRSARAVSGYISGNLAISAIAGAGAFVGMTVLGVPYALALAVLLAIFDLIPLVGATLGAIPPILAAYAISPVKGLILLAYIVIYQQIESHVLNPLVYGRSVHLPGLAVFLAIMIGGTLIGGLGALIAIPVAEILRLLLEELRGHKVEAAASPRTVSTRG